MEAAEAKLKAAEYELREQKDHYEAEILVFTDKLKALDEQGSCPYCDDTGDVHRADVHRADGEWLGECKECSDKRRITELERKLAEHRAILLKIATTNASYYEYQQWARSLGTEELNTLLAQAREEGRKEAVPEGIVSVEASFDRKPGGIITPYLKVLFARGKDSNDLWVLRDKAKAMLAAAPKPEVKP